MALSSSQDFSLDRDTLIKMAMQQSGALGEGETPNATQLTETSLLLNILIKSYINDDIQLWIRKLGYVLPVTDTNKTILGAEGGHATNSYNYTTLTATSIATATNITVAATTGMVSGYFIGIEQTDGTMYWTTISGIVGLVVTIPALPKAVAVGGSVYVYQTKINRPVRVLEAYRRSSVDNRDVQLTRWTQSEYDRFNSKFTIGQTANWFYDEVLGLSTSGYPGNGEFYIWPIPDNGDNIVVIRYTKVFDDMDLGTQNFEFPQSWFMTLFTGLTWLLNGKNGNSLSERKLAMQEYMMFHADAKSTDQELGSFYITPKYRGKR